MASETSALIVGSGIAGSLMANLLHNAGVTDITILEAGPDIKMRDPRTWYDYITTGALPYHALYDTAADFVAAGANPWQIEGGRLFGRGGSTIHWGGWTPRFMPEDFQLKTNTGIGIDWPYDYAALEPWYGKAESYIGVSGTSTPDQRDWRSTPYPMNAATLPLTASPIVDAMDSLGYSYQHMPMARNAVGYNGHGPCITTGTCDYCPVGGRMTGDQPMTAVQKLSGVTTILNAAVNGLIMSDKKTVAGVTYLDTGSGETKRIEADVVWLCSGAWEVPKLLLLSASPLWPSGVGNDNGLVGRYLVANPYIYCRAHGTTNPEKLQQELNFPTLCSRQWDTPEEQAHGKFLMNMSYGAPLLKPAAMMYQGQTADAINSAVTGTVTYELQGAISPLPYYENQVMPASGTTRFGLPRTSFFTPKLLVPDSTITLNTGRMAQIFEKMGFTVDAMGAYPQRGDHSSSTCRMAISDSEGVVDSSMKVFGTDNLYIASNAALPTLGAANLTLTLVAAIMKAFNDVKTSKPSWLPGN